MDAQFCTSCGASIKDLQIPRYLRDLPPLYPDQPKKRSGVNVFGSIAYSSVLIIGFGFAGGAIALFIAFSTMASELSAYGLIGLFMIMFYGGMGMVAGGVIGIVVAIIIGLISTPNKTKSDYFKIIGVPLITAVLIIVLLIGPSIFENGERQPELNPPAPAAAPAAAAAPATAAAPAAPADTRSLFEQDVGIHDVGIHIGCDDFLEGKHLKRDLQVQAGSFIHVSLCFNTFGEALQWSPTAQISDGTILIQTAYRFRPPPNDLVGAAGTAEWIFEAPTKGISTVLLEFRGPWVGGEMLEWSLTATIAVN